MLMGYAKKRKRSGRRGGRIEGEDSFDFVQCRICGDHRRVISGRHLSKHDTDRETYMEEYGLTPDELIAKAFRVIQSSRLGYYPHGKSDWIAAVKKLHKQGESVFAGDLQDKHPYLYDQGVWIFGDWDKALQAAGFDPEKMRLQSLWDRQKIIKKLQHMRDQNFPLYACYMLKNHAALFSSSRREFGSWNNVLRAAGITKQMPKKLHKSRLGTLRSLRDVVEKSSKAAIPAALKSQASYYFGSLRKALAALKTDERLLSGWSKQKIITTLLRMQRAKESLSSWKARCEVPAVASAARNYFGSWRNALQAAGIDPDRHIKRYKRRKRSVNRVIAGVARDNVMAHTYTEAVTVNPRVASKRRLCLSANIRTSRRHAKALL
jgi:hypothetical protein